MILLSDFIQSPVTPVEAIVLRELITFPMVTRERFYKAIWGFGENFYPPHGCRSLVATHICRLRPHLKPWIKIAPHYGMGYRLLVQEEERAAA